MSLSALPIVPSSPAQSYSDDDEKDVKLTTSHDDEESTPVDEAAQKKLERRFLRRLDLCLITWAFCSYVMKQVDTSNYKTAFASGMKEDLNMFGLELNYFETAWRVGYAICLLPSQYLLLKVRPNIFLPLMEILWGSATMLMAACHSTKPMYALRFLIGSFEASSYPGIITILCAWYTPSELAVRIAIFSTSYPAANILVGSMQAALHKGMNGVASLPGWRWLFLFNGLMTIIIAAGGFWFVPANPGEAKVFWLNEDMNKLSRERMDKVNKLPQKPLTGATLKRTFKKVYSSYVIYIFSVLQACWSFSQNSNAYTILWFKSIKNAAGKQKFSVEVLNSLMLPGNAMQIVIMVAVAWAAGKWGKRIYWFLAPQVLMLIGQAILIAWPAGFGVKTFAYFLLWTGNSGGPILIAWMADLVPSSEERALTLGSSIVLIFIIDAWQNVLVYPTPLAPQYAGGFKGFKVAAMYTCLTLILPFVWYRLDQRNKVSREARQTEELQQAREDYRLEQEAKVAAQ